MWSGWEKKSSRTGIWLVARTRHVRRLESPLGCKELKPRLVSAGANLLRASGTVFSFGCERRYSV